MDRTGEPGRRPDPAGSGPGRPRRRLTGLPHGHVLRRHRPECPVQAVSGVIVMNERFENFAEDDDEWFSDMELRVLDLEKELSEWRESRASEFAEPARRRPREREAARPGISGNMSGSWRRLTTPRGASGGSPSRGSAGRPTSQRPATPRRLAAPTAIGTGSSCAPAATRGTNATPAGPRVLGHGALPRPGTPGPSRRTGGARSATGPRCSSTGGGARPGGPAPGAVARSPSRQPPAWYC